jgi:hypothetical protein
LAEATAKVEEVVGATAFNKVIGVIDELTKLTNTHHQLDPITAAITAAAVETLIDDLQHHKGLVEFVEAGDDMTGHGTGSDTADELFL